MRVTERIAYIQSLFRKVYENPARSFDPAEDVEDFLPEYIAVLYEARAAQLAAQDFKLWNSFFEHFAERHRSQLLVGLGWSLAEAEKYDLFAHFSSSSDRWRIADGCGYFSGLFKRREAVRQQLFPEGLTSSYHAGFDQGLGRSFWYLMQGDPERIRDLIGHFTAERQPNLWRGVGLAMAYVGGINKEEVRLLAGCAGPHLPSLKCGALLALDGRSKSGTALESDLLLKELLVLPAHVDLNRLSEFEELLSDLERSLAGG